MNKRNAVMRRFYGIRLYWEKYALGVDIDAVKTRTGTDFIVSNHLKEKGI